MKQKNQWQSYEYHSSRQSVGGTMSPAHQSRRRKTRRVLAIGVFMLIVGGLGLVTALSAPHSVVASTVASIAKTASAKVNKAALPTSTLPTTLPKSLASIIGSTSSSVDVAVYDDKTGQTVHYSNASTTYSTASIVKLSILEELLIQDQAEDQGITTDQLSYATPMIENSNNDAATELWNEVGEGPTMQTFFNTVGANSTTVNAAGHWGLTQTTALDQLKILKQFAYPSSSTLLSTSSIDTVTSLLANVEDDQDWGVSAGVPSTANVLLKNGWLDDTDGWDVNSIGHITSGSVDYTVAVLTSDNDTEADGISMIENLSTAIYSAVAAA